MIKSPEIGVFLTFCCLLGASTVGAEPPRTEGWTQNLQEALAEAKEKDRLIVVDLWADWCTWCKKLEAEVFTSDVFREWAADKVLLRINTEDGAEGTRLQEDFGVTGLPTTLIVSHDRIRIGQLQGFSPAPIYVQNLDLELAMYHMLARAYRDVDDTTAIGTLQTLADDFHSRRDGERAASLYLRLLDRGEDSPEEVAWNRYYYADALRLSADFGAATEALAPARKAAEAIEEEAILELVDLLPYYIARDREACDDVEVALEGYLDLHPEGIYLEVAEEVLAKIRQTRLCA